MKHGSTCIADEAKRESKRRLWGLIYGLGSAYLP